MHRLKQRTDKILELTKRLERKGLYLIARVIVLLLLGSILFFPVELRIMLATPVLLGAILFANIILAIVLLTDLLYSQQKSVGALAAKYIYLTACIIMAYGLFYYINSTLIQPPGIQYTFDTYAQNDLERDIFYFSGTTYLTIGYGDVVPVGVYARTAAVAEAFTGSLINLIVIGKAFQNMTAKGGS